MNRRYFTSLSAALALALAAALSGCKSDGAKPQNPQPDGAKAPAQDKPPFDLRPNGPTLAPRSQGVPHSANIDTVVLSLGGKAAISRDILGGMRFWKSLDGASEPMLLPLRGARQFSLARSENGFTIAAVDGANGGHILQVDQTGQIRETYSSLPHQPVQQTAVVAGGSQVLFLLSDYRILVRSLDGEVISELEDRRFRPRFMLQSDDSKRVLVVSRENASVGEDLSFEWITLGPTGLTREDKAPLSSANAALAVSPARLALSPDGSRIAYLTATDDSLSNIKKALESARALGRHPHPAQSQRPVPGALVVLDLGSGETMKRSLDFPPQEMATIHLGFADKDTLIVTSRPSGGARKITLRNGELHSQAISTAVANDSQRHASDVEKGRLLTADGTWLYVKDLSKDESHYLGYRSFDPQYAGVSPDNRHVVLTQGSELYIDSIDDGGQTSRLVAPPSEAYFRASFISPKRIVAVDHSGGIHLIDRESGKRIASADGGGSLRDFEVNAKNGLVRGVNNRTGTFVAQVKGDTILGPYPLNYGSYRSGFLEGDKALWTLGPRQKYREFTLEEVRRGEVTRDDDRGRSYQGSPGVPLAVDRLGRLYRTRSKEGRAELFIRDRSDLEAGESSILLTAFPQLIVPSPDSKKVALINTGTSAIQVYDTESKELVWSASLRQGLHAATWSPDSRLLAAVATVGAQVFDAESGATQSKNCGPRMEKRKTAPTHTMSFQSVQNLCERFE